MTLLWGFECCLDCAAAGACTCGVLPNAGQGVSAWSLRRLVQQQPCGLFLSSVLLLEICMLPSGVKSLRCPVPLQLVLPSQVPGWSTWPAVASRQPSACSVHQWLSPPRALPVQRLRWHRHV